MLNASLIFKDARRRVFHESEVVGGCYGSVERPRKLDGQSIQRTHVSAVTVYDHNPLKTSPQNRLAQVPQESMPCVEADRERATERNVVLGQSHPDGRRNHYGLGLTHDMSRSSTCLGTEHIIRPGREMRTVLL